ncbi:hypothetical protein JCM10908_001859 [Rhodotorula pacifica]|uniref:uncharacterized protein n=1 Tax=Rhodotorula pacifica TaxID=1495444 RepID=UPI00316E5EC4
MTTPYNTTGTGGPVGAGGAYDSHHSTTIGTAHPTTGDKLASMVPGTEQNKEKKELTGTDAGHTTTQHHAATGVGAGGIGSTTHTGTSGYGAGGNTTSTGYGHSTGGVHDSHHSSSTIGTAHPTTGDKVASMVPGTEQNKEKKALDNQYGSGTHSTGAAGYGTTSTGAANYSSTTTDPAYGATHGSHATHGATGTHAHGTHGTHAGPIAGAESHIPGTTEHKATHGGAAVGSGTHGTHTGTTHTGTHGHDTTHTGTHGHGHDNTTATSHKPSVADKIGGKIDVAIGKMTHNEGKVVQGEIKQTEGKAGLTNAGLAGGPGTTGATGTHTTH